MQRYSRILVGVDGSPTAFVAAQRALDVAAACGAELHVLDVVVSPSPNASVGVAGVDALTRRAARDEAAAAEALDTVRRRATELNVSVVMHLEHGEPAAMIVRTATALGADVIVVGNRGVDASGRYVRSSVPDAVLYSAACDVLIVDTS